MTVIADLDARLLDALRAATGRPELAYSREPVPLTGGFWAELRSFALADPPAGWPADLVARVMPDPMGARRETIVQAAVAAAGYPTPAVRASGGPDTAIGRAFMVMDFATGSPLMPGLNGAGALLAVVRQAAMIPEVLASAMTTLHELDPRPVGATLASLGDVPVTQPDFLDMLHRAAAGCRRDDLASAGRWLIEHPRPPAPDVICHGDLHPFNVLIARDQLTVLDWSSSLLAPRAYDVAFTSFLLAQPPLALPASLRPFVRATGRVLAGSFVRRYEAKSSVAIGRDELRWHQAVVCLRALTEVAWWAADEGPGERRADHPWLALGQPLAAHLSTVTGVAVRPV